LDELVIEFASAIAFVTALEVLAAVCGAFYLPLSIIRYKLDIIFSGNEFRQKFPSRKFIVLLFESLKQEK
jgi:hypothetical protein